jgi:hypothetical protein
VQLVARGLEEGLRDLRQRARAGIGGRERKQARLRPKIFAAELRPLIDKVWRAIARTRVRGAGLLR